MSKIMDFGFIYVIAFGIALLMVLMVVDGFIQVSEEIERVDKIEQEIGKRIGSDEYECYNVCDGFYYYSPPTSGFFSSSSPVCECGITNIREVN